MLQPLDVGMFKPLSTAYSTQLVSHLHKSQGMLTIVKGDFFLLFWNAWGTAFKPQSIKKSFEAPGIYPPNPEVVLKRFCKGTSDSDESSSSIFEGDNWIKMESILRRTVKDQSSKDVKKV